MPFPVLPVVAAIAVAGFLGYRVLENKKNSPILPGSLPSKPQELPPKVQDIPKGTPVAPQTPPVRPNPPVQPQVTVVPVVSPTNPTVVVPQVVPIPGTIDTSNQKPHGSWYISPSGYNLYKAGAGDGFPLLAMIYLNDPNRWHEIFDIQSADWKRSRGDNPSNNLRVGDQLYMPSEAVDKAKIRGEATGGRGAFPQKVVPKKVLVEGKDVLSPRTQAAIDANPNRDDS